MTSRRRLLIALGLSGVGAFPVLGQESAKVRRIGFLAVRSRSTPSAPDAYYGLFVSELAKLGYVDGRNLAIEWRFADGQLDRLPGLASQLVERKVELIVTHGPGTLAVRRATGSIPIVTVATVDPVRFGLAKSLARPGGNVTGLHLVLSYKRMELLKMLLPNASRYAVLLDPGNPQVVDLFKDAEAIGEKVGVQVVPIEARSPADLPAAFAAMKKQRADALVVAADAKFYQPDWMQRIVALAAQHGMPAAYWSREFVDIGGLLSYGENLNEFYVRAASFVDRILKGAKPGELPFEQVTTQSLVINRRTARALGIAIPQELAARADEVID